MGEGGGLGQVQGAILARSAIAADAGRICELVNTWADAGLTIRRRPDEILDMIGEFVVVERCRDEIIACGALAAHSPSLAEIRSVAASENSKGTGAGSEVVWFLLEAAVQLEIDRVVLLTKIPGFFSRFGFREIAPTDLPEDFVAEAITGRGRTFASRTVMMRDMSVPLPKRVIATVVTEVVSEPKSTSPVRHGVVGSAMARS